MKIGEIGGTQKGLKAAMKRRELDKLDTNKKGLNLGRTWDELGMIIKMAVRWQSVGCLPMSRPGMPGTERPRNARELEEMEPYKKGVEQAINRRKRPKMQQIQRTIKRD